MKVNGGSEEARRRAQAWLSPLESHLAEAGLGHVSEIFEGDTPHRPCGCIAQAWSVAEILRVYFEEVRSLRPNRRPNDETPKKLESRLEEARSLLALGKTLVR